MMTVDAVLVDAPRIALFTTVNATHVNEFFGMPGTNRRIEFRNARLMETDEMGLITLERRIYDFTGLLVQVGILRAKPAKP
jgi:predicted ester cyclase